MPEKNRREIEESTNKIASVTENKAAAEKKLVQNMAKLQDQTKDLIRDKKELENQLAGLKPRVDETKSELGLIEAEMKILTQNETVQLRKYEAAQKAYDANMAQHEEVTGKVAALEENWPRETARQKECQTELAAKEAREVVVREELQRGQSYLNDVRGNMQASQSQNKVINALMEERQKGSIPGILGRLGDLGGIDLRYDVAISTCCGRLDNVVVDTVDTAQACIEFLKRHNVGRASFIALEKIQHLKRYCDQRVS